MEECEEAVTVVKAYEDIKIKKKNIICIAYRQGLIIKKD